MGSLSNLYISQSYQGLLTFSTNSGSTSTLTQISDGNGQGLGLYLNNSGSASLTSNLTIGGDLTVSGAFDIEGAIVIRDNVYVTGSIYSSADISSSRMLAGQMTASNAFITSDLNVGGTLFANKVVTLIESSSIIFSSGSNILGDSILDTQTLNGSIIMSGSSSLTGSMQVSADISSSTLNGMGNVNQFVTSIQASTSSLNLFSASAQISLNNINQFTSSANDKFLAIQASTASLNNFTASQQPTFNALNAFTASQNTKNSTLALYTASVDSQFVQVGASTSSLNTFSASAQYSINALSALTASANVTTGSNTFTGKQTYSSSVVGQVIPLTIVSSTASMDCSLGNFFTLSMPTASVNLNPINIQIGQTITLRVLQNATTPANVTYPTSIKFPFQNSYVATLVTSSIDILTFVSYDTSSLFGVAANRLT